MRREYDYDTSKVGYQNGFTNNGSINVTTLKFLYISGYRNIGFFIVAGGGAGTGDFFGSDSNGFGGCGGECMCITLPLVYSTGVGIYIGAGGAGGTRDADAANGGDSYVEYNGTTYTALGGWGGKKTFRQKTLFDTYPRGLRKWGGCGGWWGGASVTDQQTRIATWYNYTPEQAIAATTSSEIYYSLLGETGVKNPLNPADNTYYGCGGGAGFDAYRGVDLSSTYPNYGGLNNVGGGRGGYGANNATTNNGADAVTYGSGGGGGAFSSTHTYSLGGNGKGGYVYVKIF